MRKKMRIKWWALILSVLLLSAPLCSCSSEPPPLEDVRERFVQLIEDSQEINDIFFGEGLPTYARDSKENEILYYGFFGYDAYEIVRADCPYQNVSQIKEQAEGVYSKQYLDDIYVMAFDGYADENSDKVTTARYLHAGEYFLKYAQGEEDPFRFLPGKRLYRYDTMEIGALSSEEAVNLEIDSYLEGDEDNVLRVTLRFVLQNGEWYLDTPTY